MRRALAPKVVEAAMPKSALVKLHQTIKKVTEDIESLSYNTAISALMGVETTVCVVSATAGIEVNTRRMMDNAKAFGLARTIVINKINGENVNLSELLGQVQEAFGQECAAVNLAVGKGSSFGGTYNLWDSKAEAPGELGSVAEGARERSGADLR